MEAPGPTLPAPRRQFALNLPAIALTKDNTFHSRTKLIDIQYRYVHDTVLMEANTADIFGSVYTPGYRPWDCRYIHEGSSQAEDRNVYAQHWFVPAPSRLSGSIGGRQSVEVRTGVVWTHGPEL